MIIEVFGTLCMLQFYSRKPVNLLLACSFSAHLPKFNPAIPKLQELGEDLQDSQRKIVKLRSDQNTSKIMWTKKFIFKTLSKVQLEVPNLVNEQYCFCAQGYYFLLVGMGFVAAIFPLQQNMQDYLLLSLIPYPGPGLGLGGFRKMCTASENTQNFGHSISTVLQGPNQSFISLMGKLADREINRWGNQQKEKGRWGKKQYDHNIRG